MGITLDFAAARNAEQKGLPCQTAVVETPLGRMTLVQRGDDLCELRLNGEQYPTDVPAQTPLLTRAQKQLTEYFSGERTSFDLPLAPLGTSFMELVWQTLTASVPYGRTVTYGELAALCGHPRAARAVGMANHRNPLPIFIPCHRVVGAGGKLVGYGGGLPLKRSLLELETRDESAADLTETVG